MLPRLLAILAVGLLSACASVIEGTTENLTVNSTPPGATCNLDRDGVRLGSIVQTPGTVNVSKSKNDVVVSCTLAEHQPSSTTVSPRFRGTTFGNILLGGVVGVLVDAGTGANFDLPDLVTVAMVPTAPPVLAPAPYYTPLQPGQPGS